MRSEGAGQGTADAAARVAVVDRARADADEAGRQQIGDEHVGLADQTLTQARDRFAAGVTDNIEVVQAQQSVSNAQQNLISSIYAHNLAKVALARAIGSTEANLKTFMGGK